MALTSGGPGVEGVIEVLKDKVERGGTGADARGRMFQVFQDISQGKMPKLPDMLHCEILLATLRLAPLEEITLGSNDARLQEICKVC